MSLYLCKFQHKETIIYLFPQSRYLILLKVYHNSIIHSRYRERSPLSSKNSILFKKTFRTKDNNWNVKSRNRCYLVPSFFFFFRTFLASKLKNHLNFIETFHWLATDLQTLVMCRLKLRLSFIWTRNNFNGSEASATLFSISKVSFTCSVFFLYIILFIYYYLLKITWINNSFDCFKLVNGHFVLIFQNWY